MHALVKKDILSILTSASKALKQSNITTLRQLSDQTLHNANIYQDPEAITIAVTMYALFKIYSRPNYAKLPTWTTFDTNVKNNLLHAKQHLEKNDYSEFSTSLKNITSIIDKLDKKLRSYLKDVIYRAHISKASRFYEHGVSIGRTAELLGVTRWELMDYVGKTGIPDKKYNITKTPKQRLKEAKAFFNQ
ncbi:hypothetical protein CL622_08090 [archaeon]|nr:hypothetical protein [archaeon]|tara:strand:+ start:1488 stop:2057 length:570 start_codon:yes stop_codon:yes gene_type:complete